MNNLQVFKNEQFGEVRVMERNGEPWFVGKDVAEILGYERSTKAVADHVDPEDRDAVPIQDSIGRMQNTPIINESGLYSLILSSKLPAAKKFKRWVTSEVLPSIRKHGDYISDTSDLSPELRLLINMERQQRAQEKRLAEVEEAVQATRDIIALNPNSWRSDATKMIVRIAQKMGGNEYISTVHNEIYKLLDERFKVNLSVRLTNMRRRMAEEGISKSKRDKANRLDVIAEDKKLIEGFLIIVKEMAIKYGVTEVA